MFGGVFFRPIGRPIGEAARGIIKDQGTTPDVLLNQRGFLRRGGSSRKNKEYPSDVTEPETQLPVLQGA